MAASAVRLPPTVPADRDLTGATDLLAAGGASRVARFLDERGLEPHRVEPAQAHYRPGRWLAVCFRTAAVERSSGRPLTPTVTVECRAGEPEAVWAFPEDPALAGLAAAFDSHLVRRRLRPRPAAVEVEPLRYRPRRRAVLRYRLVEGAASAAHPGGRVLYGKVVTPARGRRLLALAGALGPSGLRLALPVGRLAPGALVLPCLPGASLRDRLLTGKPVPAPERLVGLAEDLHRRCSPLLPAGRPSDPGALRRRVDPGTALGAAQVVARLRPDLGCTAARVAEAVIGCAEESEPPEARITHGDLYENQVLVDGETLGLLDLDDLGWGDPLLDAANFSAHLLVLGTADPSRAATVLRYRDELRAAFCAGLGADPVALAWREAYCLLRLASGPFRVLHPDWPRRMADRLTLAARALRR
ncbi:MAG: phosphotransferase [Actinomycetota bacterium]|jgi:hypothetical protein